MEVPVPIGVVVFCTFVFSGVIGFMLGIIVGYKCGSQNL